MAKFTGISNVAFVAEAVIYITLTLNLNNMEKPITRKQHGFTDYSYVPFVVAAPSLVGFEDEPTAVQLTRGRSGNILATSLFTRAE